MPAASAVLAGPMRLITSGARLARTPLKSIPVYIGRAFV